MFNFEQSYPPNYDYHGEGNESLDREFRRESHPIGNRCGIRKEDYEGKWEEDEDKIVEHVHSVASRGCKTNHYDEVDYQEGHWDENETFSREDTYQQKQSSKPRVHHIES